MVDVQVLLIVYCLLFCKIRHPNECNLYWVLKMMMNTFPMISSLKWMNFASGMEKNMNGKKQPGILKINCFKGYLLVILFQRTANQVWVRIFTNKRSSSLSSQSANQNFYLVLSELKKKMWFFKTPSVLLVLC